jgi:hypothetical protein
MSALGRGGSQPGLISLINNSAVQYVSSCGEVEVVCRKSFETEGFERRELVDGRNDCLLFERLDWDMIRDGGRYWRYRGLGGCRGGYRSDCWRGKTFLRQC